MAKHTEKVGSFDDFQAPWETESGTDAEIDKAKLKRLIFNLRAGEAKALDERDEARESAKTAETERDEAKAEAEKASPEEANRKIAKLEKQVTDLTAERDGLVKAKELADLRSEVLAGIDPKVAKYVKGDTKEELEKSLAEVKEDFGLSDEEDSEFDGRTAPKSRLTNPLDEKSGRDKGDNYDFEKVAEGIVSRSIFS